MLDARFETLLCLDVDHTKNIQAMKVLVVQYYFWKKVQPTCKRLTAWVSLSAEQKPLDTARTIKQRLTRVLGIMDGVNGCL